MGQKKSALNAIPAGYNHAVLFDLYDMQNDVENVQDKSSPKTDKFLDANKGRKDSEYIHIFYNTSQITKFEGNAIADIVVFEGERARVPSGYTIMPHDLNNSCGNGSKFLWLAYRTATDTDNYLIDFISGFWYDKETNLPTLRKETDGSRWEHVYKHNGITKTSQVADLADGCGSGSKYIRLVVHKIPRPESK